jgi:hypothetical protein
MATDKIQIGLRVSEELREKLQTAARDRGVTVNKEISDRLEKSLSEDFGAGWMEKGESAGLDLILQIVAPAMQVAGGMAAMMSTWSMESRNAWVSNSIAYDQALKAAVEVLEKLRPQTEMVPDREISDNVQTAGIKTAVAILDEATTGKSRIDQERAEKLHASLKALAERRALEMQPKQPRTMERFSQVPSMPKKGKRK